MLKHLRCIKQLVVKISHGQRPKFHTRPIAPILPRAIDSSQWLLVRGVQEELAFLNFTLGKINDIVESSDLLLKIRAFLQFNGTARLIEGPTATEP
jgi:hypothetical protein